MMRTICQALCLVAGLTSTAVATAQDNPFRKLTIDAIDSIDGTAAFRFERRIPWVKEMRKQLGTDGPVTVETKVVRRFREPGCARLQTIFTIHEATLQRGKLIDQTFSVNYNLCRDGMPPRETLDIRDIREWTSRQEQQTSQPKGLRIVPLDKPNTPWSTRPEDSPERSAPGSYKQPSASR